MEDSKKQENFEYVKISLERYEELKLKNREVFENENTILEIGKLFKGDNNFFNRKYIVKDKSNFIEDVANILGIMLEV